VQKNAKLLIDPLEVSAGQPLAGRNGLSGSSKGGTQSLQPFDTATAPKSFPKTPVAKEDVNPTGIVEVFGEAPEAITLFAVENIEPGVALAKSFSLEFVAIKGHSGSLLSLQGPGGNGVLRRLPCHPFVTIIIQLTRYTLSARTP
jgi:hypothetical protein